MAILKPGDEGEASSCLPGLLFYINSFVVGLELSFLSNPIPEQALHQGRPKWASHEVNYLHTYWISQSSDKIPLAGTCALTGLILRKQGWWCTRSRAGMYYHAPKLKNHENLEALYSTEQTQSWLKSWGVK